MMLSRVQLLLLILEFFFGRNYSLVLSEVSFHTELPSNDGQGAETTWLSGTDDKDYELRMREWDKQCQSTGLCHLYLADMALQFSIMRGGSAVLRNNDLYEFGVYTGLGIGEKSQFIKKFLGPNTTPRHVWGFDSFEGVPRSKDNPTDGLFDVRKLNNFTDWADMEHMILKNIEFPNATLIKGFYNETLNEELIRNHGMKPAWYVNIDCDIYSSTFQALDWMFKNQLMRPGTFVYYDDVLANKKDVGERKAHHDITTRYNVVWKKLLRHNKLFKDDEIVTYFFEVVSYQGYESS